MFGSKKKLNGTYEYPSKLSSNLHLHIYLFLKSHRTNVFLSERCRCKKTILHFASGLKHTVAKQSNFTGRLFIGTFHISKTKVDKILT